MKTMGMGYLGIFTSITINDYCGPEWANKDYQLLVWFYITEDEEREV